jgi:propanol-preferring alcohol dehydrogenase
MSSQGGLTVPKTCLSAQLVSYKKPLEFLEYSIPEPLDDEVIIKIEASGVCHSDVHLRDQDWEALQFPLPVTLGHEGVGRVVKLGSKVKSLKLGDRVGTAWIHSTCNDCEFCFGGTETMCQAQKNHGGGAHGSFSEYMVGNASFCGIVPESLSSTDAAPISCAGVTTYKALKQSGVRPGQWVVILGAAGGLGHIGVQYAKFMGMKVFGIDVGAEKVEFMKSLGCDAVLEGTDPNLVDKVIAGTNGGPHGVMTLVPVLKCVEQAVKYVRPLGTIVCVGLPEGNLVADTVLMVAKQVTIKGSLVGTRNDLSVSAFIELGKGNLIYANFDYRYDG